MVLFIASDAAYMYHNIRLFHVTLLVALFSRPDYYGDNYGVNSVHFPISLPGFQCNSPLPIVGTGQSNSSVIPWQESR